MTTNRIGRPPIGKRYDFIRPAEIAEDTGEIAGMLGVPEAEVTRLALEIGLNSLRRLHRIGRAT